MVDVNSIQEAYMDLYVQLRKYIWPYSTVELIADLEVASYYTMPNIFEVRNKLLRLKSAIMQVYSEDEDMKAAVDSFVEVLEEGTEVFSRLYKVEEVIQV